MPAPNLSQVQPGWLDNGVAAVVRGIEQKKAQKSGKPFWVVALADPTGPETAELSVFGRPPAFKPGDVIEITGKGVKLEDGQWGLKVSTGKDSVINVVGQSAHHAEQEERKASGQPAVNGQPNHIAGQTVGMAVKMAFDYAIQSQQKPGSFAFWQEVKQTASNIIRISKALEGGHLSPKPADWPAPAGKPAAPAAAPAQAPASTPPPNQGRQDPPKPTGPIRPGPDGSVQLPLEDEEISF